MKVDIKTKEYLTNKNVLIGILIVLLGVSIADIIMKVVVLKDGASLMSNYGESFVTAVLSVLLIFFAFMGKDRAFYILCGGWLAYFVLNQLFGLPSLIADLIFTIEISSAFGITGHLFHILSVITIIGIGGLLVEYLNDGTIYNKAFNVLCTLTFVFLAALILLSVINIIHFSNSPTVTYEHVFPIITILYDLSRIAMVFLFTYFAYDSAKTQLSKTQL